MDRRYQVFLSSTYADLREERQKVIQALMEMDCIPSCMEIFPAMDEEQWNFIKRVIDDCDYYLLIIGGRYGSMTAEGISYTEKEFDYAVEKGIKVVGLLHADPDSISINKSDTDSELRKKLEEFRTKVRTGRLIKEWHSASELPGLVALSLQKTIKSYPAIGWVRGNQTANSELLTELNDLRKQNTALEQELATIRSNLPTLIPQKKLASLDSSITITGQKFAAGKGLMTEQWEATVTWRIIFGIISPKLLSHPNDNFLRNYLQTQLFQFSTGGGIATNIDDYWYDAIKVQLMALGLVSIQYLKAIDGTMALFWSLTEEGRRIMFETRSFFATETQ